MHALRRVLSILAVGVALAACGEDDEGGARSSQGTSTTQESAGRSASDVTHTFEGTELTCEEALDINLETGCTDEIVDVWEEWGQNLPDYVSSGQLGPLNDESFRAMDVAFAGVMACVITVDGGDEQDFIDEMHDPANRTGFEDLSGTELLPAWFEAPESLCLGADMSTGDYITP